MLVKWRNGPSQFSESARPTLLTSLAVIGLCLTLLGCAKDVLVTKNLYAPTDRVGSDGVTWHWEDYSNRPWIGVSGVGLQTGSTNPMKSISFSYSPNTAKSEEEAIAITAFDMFAGSRAERFLLRVLYGTGRLTPNNRSEVLTNGKAFHIYTLTNRIGETNLVYFDATHYHGFW